MYLPEGNDPIFNEVLNSPSHWAVFTRCAFITSCVELTSITVFSFIVVLLGTETRSLVRMGNGMETRSVKLGGIIQLRLIVGFLVVLTGLEARRQHHEPIGAFFTQLGELHQVWSVGTL